MNTAITQWLNGFVHISAPLDVFIYASAEYIAYLVFVVFALLLLRNNKQSIQNFILGTGTALIAWLASQAINVISAVERPFVALNSITPLFTHGLNDSFPSGHATAMFALSIYAYQHNKKVGVYLIVLSAISGVARVTSGIHWPSDVFGSFVLAYICVYAIRYVYLKFQHE